MILVDSTAYIDWFRKRVDIRKTLGPWINARALAICGIIRAEVLRGILNPKQKATLEDFFDILEEVPTDHQLWREAGDLAWELDRKGIVLPVTDLVIAACGKRVNATIISLDAHFSKIPRLKVREDIPRFFPSN